MTLIYISSTMTGTLSFWLLRVLPRPSAIMDTHRTHEAPISKESKPSVEPRHITVQELQLFQDPDNLHGKRFVLSPDSSDDSETYEVIGYSKKRDKTVEYDVLFDECEDPIKDPITVTTKEMMEMLKDSL